MKEEINNVKLTCDICGKVETIKRNAPTPNGWFSLNGRYVLYAEVCSKKCLLDFLDNEAGKRYRENLKSIEKDYESQYPNQL